MRIVQLVPFFSEEKFIVDINVKIHRTLCTAIELYFSFLFILRFVKYNKCYKFDIDICIWDIFDHHRNNYVALSTQYERSFFEMSVWKYKVNSRISIYGNISTIWISIESEWSEEAEICRQIKMKESTFNCRFKWNWSVFWHENAAFRKPSFMSTDYDE